MDLVGHVDNGRHAAMVNRRLRVALAHFAPAVGCIGNRCVPDLLLGSLGTSVGCKPDVEAGRMDFGCHRGMCWLACNPADQSARRILPCLARILASQSYPIQDEPEGEV